MPTYNVKNLKTGEKKEFRMTMKEYCQWKEDNPDWDKDWSAGIAGTTYGGQSNPMDSKRSCRRCKRSILEQTCHVTPKPTLYANICKVQDPSSLHEIGDTHSKANEKKETHQSGAPKGYQSAH